MSEVSQISLERLARLCNPLETSPWTAPVSREDVVMALETGRLVSAPLPENEGDHAGRIAYLVLNPVSDPIDLDVGVPEMGVEVDWPVVDGNHRLAAALFRGDKQIDVTWSGSSDHFEFLFGEKTMKYEELLRELGMEDHDFFQAKTLRMVEQGPAITANKLDENRIILMLCDTREGFARVTCSAVIEREEATDIARLNEFSGSDRVPGEKVLEELGVKDPNDLRVLIDTLLEVVPAHLSQAMQRRP